MTESSELRVAFRGGAQLDTHLKHTNNLIMGYYQ